MRNRKRRIGLAAAALFAAIATSVAASDTIKLKPGRWEVTSAFVGMTVDGVEVPQEEMGPNHPTVGHVCIGPETSRNPSLYFMAGAAETCTYDGGVTDDSFDIKLKCEGPVGSTKATHTTGSYSPFAFIADHRFSLHAPEGEPEALIHVQVTASHTADTCMPADQKTP